MVGVVNTSIGEVPKVSSEWTREDSWGTFLARWKVGRMTYTVDPGLYAIGDVDDNSPILVTANYKMTFDYLRKELSGRSAWILALNTDGINVWCAAGKGTFSTAELVERIRSSGLERVTSSRRLILPQLAAPGVAAHKVKELSGFRVIYGPILASDLGKFIDSGFKATPEMRRKTFTLKERTILVPVELVDAARGAAYIAAALLLLGGLGGPADFLSNVLSYGVFAACAVFSAVAAGAIASPVLLPWLPGRAFALKGVIPGFIAAVLVLGVRAHLWGSWPHPLEAAAWLLIVPALTTYLSMNFTGASTYTSLSGVRKEMRWALPVQIASVVVGLGLWLTSRFIA